MRYVANVFGKEGCAKCALLKRRLAALLERPEYSGIEMRYHDVLTLDGVVDFCKADCLNPNRIPALLMSVVDDGGPATRTSPSRRPAAMWARRPTTTMAAG